MKRVIVVVISLALALVLGTCVVSFKAPEFPNQQATSFRRVLLADEALPSLKLGDLFSPSLRKLVVLCPYEEKPTFFEKKNHIPPGLWPGQDEASQTLIFIDGSRRDLPFRVSRGLVDFCVQGSVILRSDAAISIHSSELGFKEIIYESSST